MRKVLSFDIGGTNIKYAVIEKQHGIIEEHKFKSPETYEQLLVEIKNIFEMYKYELEPVICISCPSIYKNNIIVGSSYLQYIIGKDLPSDITNLTQCSCYIENDGNCAVLGEYYFGKHSCRNLAAIVIGSGVGGGLIVNGELLKGANMVAGELGFPIFNKDLGEEKPYKIFGSTTGMSNFIKLAQEIDNTIVTAEEVFESKSSKFDSLIQTECQIIAMQILNLQYIVDSEKVVIGGAISECDDFINEIRRQLDAYYQKLPYHDTKSNVFACTYGNKSNLLGATVEYWRKNEKCTFN